MSYDIIKEDVPPFTKRIGDRVIQGSNNTIIILGTDRAKFGKASVADGVGHVNAIDGGKGTGTIHMIVGRTNPGDPDLDNDKAYFYLSMKTDIDKNMKTEMEGNSGLLSAAAIKADAIRLVGRKNIKISFNDQNFILIDDEQCFISIKNSGFIKIKNDKIVIDANNIELGEGAVDRLIKGDAFKQFFMLHKHGTGTGPSSPPIDQWIDSTLLSSRKATVK